MTTTDIAQIRDHIIGLDTSRARVEEFAEAFTPADEAIAYRAQEALCQSRLAAQGKVVGYKIGLTSPQIRQQTGLSTPIYGPIHEANVHATPARFARTRFVRLGLELEICLRLGADIAPSATPHNIASVSPAIASLMPAYELIEDRGADYSRLKVMTVIADGGWNGGVVLGSPRSDWRQLDLTKLAGTVRIDGQETARGLAGEVMGHCILSLVWLADRLGAAGTTLKAGMLIMTGSMVRTQFPQPGQTAAASIEALGDISVTLV